MMGRFLGFLRWLDVLDEGRTRLSCRGDVVLPLVCRVMPA